MYNGKCANDGLYYRDSKSFIFCSNGNSYEQYCAPGTKNSDYEKYQSKGHYSYRDFCDVNLVDHGYAAKHYQPKYEAPKYEEPKYEAPKYEEPKYEAPKYEEPKEYGYGYNTYDRRGYGYGGRDYGYGRRDYGYGRRDYGYGYH